MPSPMQRQTCPHCQRRRVATIHPTRGGGVMRLEFTPCVCPAARRIDGSRQANRYIAKLALIPAAITGFLMGFAGFTAGVLSAGTIGLVAAVVYLMNGPRR